ncbi:RNA polymerase sigma-54 factor 2 [Candidatus Phycosocius bacilliformis]|uniref:RNA polymerase sigma-54 factor n=1 Tax=Candidatus Phycosocius bacilliformis TaxID=1445552 RepID=A0A2P2EDY0_9PROT|nr:RNA polymerase factor sigma-54 [Candidatus Phycosocius bacilliformis]GBF59264.1 RNA polymerase sigma-54 factor 2 [Candidatus Phycosocius bacilliformis]
MAIAPRMELRQGQGLVMTPQLQQAIKLLQMSTAELALYVEQELERNPVLERADDGDDYGISDTPESEAHSPSSGDEGPQELCVSGESPDPHAESALDAGYEDIQPDADRPASEAIGATVDWSKAGDGRGGFDDLEDLESRLTQTVSLRDHLEAQAALAFASPADRLIASYLIDHVDDAGYLRIEMEEVCARLGLTTDDLEAVIATLQTFDPTGVCARSVEECLAAQLKERNRFDPAMAALVANLHLLAKHDLKSLYDICGVDGADLAEMIGEIRALTPKPGAAFGSTDSIAVVPDVFVREGPMGTWLIELNADTLPRVLVNNAYAESVSRLARSQDERSYVAEAQADANWLVKSLDQRARTILKVAKEIVRQQDGFLTYGVAHLRPLILKDVARAIDMHESTVSRVTSNKFIATPRGVFELKYFFTTAIHASDGGEAHSAEAVRHRIKSLIDGETQDAPLSDDRIVEILRETGVDIARRTVAKYREALRIPSSVHRRRTAGRAG